MREENGFFFCLMENTVYNYLLVGYLYKMSCSMLHLNDKYAHLLRVIYKKIRNSNFRNIPL